MKIYTDKVKYSGENNSFTSKLTIFHDTCIRADVFHEIKLKIFLTMLISLALDYNYLNVSISATITFDKIYNSI